ncbi:glycoside hydrolase family 9 protein [Cystobasidium minutum MCA 4210]|uniref:glycoside hydrolase family 9 protein n=1 Tax=Cystobasidium minutum MCA 4210 TaxID=1397322 RepID=UPI0034D01872|eukprot:jgi/Rhomi1/206098/MIX6927_151_100
MTRSSMAAGLLFLFLFTGQMCVAGPLSEGLVDSFRARALAKRFHQEQRTISRPLARDHRRHRRQGQIRLAVNKEATNSSTVVPPQIVRPKVKLESPIGKKEDSGMDKMSGSQEPMGPRKGRPNRDIKAIIEADMESGGDVDDGAVEFMISEMEKEMMRVMPMAGMPQYGAITFRDGRVDFEPGSSETSTDSSTSSAPSPPEAPALPLEKRDSELRAVNTWEGHPSPYRPKKPYEPSKHSKSEDYADIVSKSLWFYQVQRSGLLMASPRPVRWRNDSALKDGFDNNIDLTGGYYDAGDYLKFTFPLSAAMTTLAWAGTDHYDGVTKSNNMGYWDETLRWGLDWMMKAHPSADVLYVQVGDGKVDNNYWGGDRTIPTPRPSFSIDRGSPGTDAAAGAAAAFASGAIFYSAIIGDQDYAKRLLKHAISLYYFAESAPKLVYQKSVPAVGEWYASSDYADELVLAGLLLYRATSNIYFLQRAELYFNKYKVYESRDPVDWDSKHGLCFLLGAQLVEQAKITSSVDWKANLAAYLKEAALKQGKTPGGLLYYPGSSDENSLPTAMGITYIMTEYARLFPSDPLSKQLRQLADQQIDYVFGSNPRGMTYIVGITEKSPKNPQSAMASGGNDIGNIDHSPEHMAHVLYGGMVGGPAKDDSFQDKRSNYKQSECALDYNAPITAIMVSEFELGKLPYYARQPLQPANVAVAGKPQGRPGPHTG